MNPEQSSAGLRSIIVHPQRSGNIRRSGGPQSFGTEFPESPPRHHRRCIRWLKRHEVEAGAGSSPLEAVQLLSCCVNSIYFTLPSVRVGPKVPRRETSPGSVAQSSRRRRAR